MNLQPLAQSIKNTAFLMVFVFVYVVVVSLGDNFGGAQVLILILHSESWILAGHHMALKAIGRFLHTHTYSSLSPTRVRRY